MKKCSVVWSLIAGLWFWSFSPGVQAKPDFPELANKDVRVALLVGAEHGWKNEPVLQSPLRVDIPRMKKALWSNGFRRIEVLENPNKLTLARKLSRLTSQNITTFFFYYSGHSDKQSLHLGHQSYSYVKLVTALSNMKKVKRTLLVLDSCNSAGSMNLLIPRLRGKGSAILSPVDGLGGALLSVVNKDLPTPQRFSSLQRLVEWKQQEGISTRHFQAKGFRWKKSKTDISKLPPVFRNRGYGMQIVASSTKAYEGVRGSIYTRFFAEGLQGRADRNGDGIVLFGEAFAYARERTRAYSATLGDGTAEIQEMERLSLFRGDMPMALKLNATLRLGGNLPNKIRLVARGGFVYDVERRAGAKNNPPIQVPAGQLWVMGGGKCLKKPLVLKPNEKRTITKLTVDCSNRQASKKGKPGVFHVVMPAESLQVMPIRIPPSRFEASNTKTFNKVLKSKSKDLLALLLDLLLRPELTPKQLQEVAAALAYLKSVQPTLTPLQRVFAAQLDKRLKSRGKSHQKKHVLQHWKTLVQTILRWNPQAHLPLSQWKVGSKGSTEHVALVVELFYKLRQSTVANTALYGATASLDKGLRQFVSRLEWKLDSFRFLMEVERHLRATNDGMKYHKRSEIQLFFRNKVIPVLLQKGRTARPFVGTSSSEAGFAFVPLPKGWKPVEDWLRDFFLDLTREDKPFRISLKSSENNVNDCFYLFSHPVLGRCPLTKPLATHPLVIRILRTHLLKRLHQTDVLHYLSFLSKRALSSPALTFSAGTLLLQAASEQGVVLKDVLYYNPSQPVTKGSKAWWVQHARRILQTVVTFNDGLLAAKYRSRSLPKAWRLTRQKMEKWYQFIPAWEEALLGSASGTQILSQVAKQRLLNTWKRFNTQAAMREVSLRNNVKHQVDYLYKRARWSLKRYKKIHQFHWIQRELKKRQTAFRSTLRKARVGQRALLAQMTNPLAAQWLGIALLQSPPKSMEARLFAQWLVEVLFRSPVHFARALKHAWPLMVHTNRGALTLPPKQKNKNPAFLAFKGSSSSVVTALSLFAPWARLRGQWFSLELPHARRTSLPTNPWARINKNHRKALEEVAAYFWSLLQKSRLKLSDAAQLAVENSKIEREKKKFWKALSDYRAWTTLFGWMGVPSLRYEEFQRVLGLRDTTPVNEGKKNQPKNPFVLKMQQSIYQLQQLNSQIMMLTSSISKGGMTYALRHPWLKDANPLPTLFRTLQELVRGCETDGLCLRTVAEQALVLSQRHIGVSSQVNAMSLGMSQTIRLILNKMPKKHASPELKSLRLRLAWIKRKLLNQKQIWAPENENPGKANEGSASKSITFSFPATSLWGLDNLLTRWSHALQKIHQGRCVDISALPKRQAERLSKIQRESRVALGLAAVLLSHTDLSEKETMEFETLPEIRWGTPSRWLTRFAPSSSSTQVLLASVPWNLRTRLRHPVQLLLPLLQRAAYLDRHTYQTMRPVDLDGLTPDYSSPYTWVHVQKRLHAARKQVGQWEKRLRKARKHKEMLKSINGIKSLLSVPLVVNLSDFRLRVQSALAALARADAHLEAARQRVVYARLQSQVQDLMIQIAKLEQNRNQVLLKIQDLEIDKNKLEKKKVELRKKIAELKIKGEKKALEVRRVRKEVGKIELQIRKKQIAIAARGFVVLEQQVKLLMQLLIEKIKVPNTNEEVRGQLGLMAHQLKQQVKAQLESIKKKIAETEKKIEEIKEMSFFRALGKFFGAVIGGLIGGPFGMKLGAMIGDGLGRLVAQIKQGKPIGQILGGLLETSLSVSKEAGYDIAEKAEEAIGLKADKLAESLLDGASAEKIFMEQAPSVLTKVAMKSGLKDAIETRCKKWWKKLKKVGNQLPNSLPKPKITWKQMKEGLKPHFKELMKASYDYKPTKAGFKYLQKKIYCKVKDLKIKDKKLVDMLNLPKSIKGDSSEGDPCEEGSGASDDSSGEHSTPSTQAMKNLRTLTMEVMLRASQKAQKQRDRLLSKISVALMKLQDEGDDVDEDAINKQVGACNVSNDDKKEFIELLSLFDGKSLSYWANINDTVEQLAAKLYPKDSKRQVFIYGQLQGQLDRQSLNAQLQKFLKPWHEAVEKKQSEIVQEMNKEPPSNVEGELATLKWQLGVLKGVAERWENFLEWLSNPTNKARNQIALKLTETMRKLQDQRDKLDSKVKQGKIQELNNKALEAMFQKAGFVVEMETLGKKLVELTGQQVDMNLEQERKRKARVKLLLKQNKLTIKYQFKRQKALLAEFARTQALERAARASARVAQVNLQAMRQRKAVYERVEKWYWQRPMSSIDAGLVELKQAQQGYKRSVNSACRWGREALRYMRDVGDHRDIKRLIQPIRLASNTSWETYLRDAESKINARYALVQPQIGHSEIRLQTAQIQNLYKPKGACIAIKMKASGEDIKKAEGRQHLLPYEMTFRRGARLFGLAFVGGRGGKNDHHAIRKDKTSLRWLAYYPVSYRVSKTKSGRLLRRKVILRRTTKARHLLQWSIPQRNLPVGKNSMFQTDLTRDWRIVLRRQAKKAKGIAPEVRAMRGVPLESTVCLSVSARKEFRAKRALLILYYTHYGEN